MLPFKIKTQQKTVGCIGNTDHVIRAWGVFSFIYSFIFFLVRLIKLTKIYQNKLQTIWYRTCLTSKIYLSEVLLAPCHEAINKLHPGYNRNVEKYLFLLQISLCNIHTDNVTRHCCKEKKNQLKIWVIYPSPNNIQCRHALYYMY